MVASALSKSSVFDEVRIAERQAEVRETIHCLLPADHAVRRIFQDQDHEVQLEPNRGFHFLRIHHEPAVPADGEDAAFGIKHSRHHCRRQSGTHGRQRVVQQEGIRHIGPVVACEPDLVHSVVERDDAVFGNDLSYIMHDALRGRRPAILGGPIS